MGNDIENLQVSVDTISDELQLIKTQNSRTALSLDEINSNLQNIAEKESVSKETFLTSQEQVAGYITSNLAERVNEVYRNVDTIKNSIETVNEVKAVEMREILGGLSLKISALQDAMKSYTDDKHTELKMILDDLNEVSKTTIANIERNNLFGFSGLNTNIEELSKAFAQSHDELTKSQAENVENLINSIFVLSNKIEAHFAVEDSSDEIASLIELVNDVKANLEATNVDMLSFIKSEFVDLKEVVKSLDLTALEEKMSALSMLLVSPSSQMDTVIAELNGQFEALKYTITATSTNSEVVDKVTSYVNEFQNTLNEFSKNSQNEFEEFKKAMVVFNDSLNKIYSENDIKLAQTLSETSSVKVDILALKESLENYSIQNIEGLKERFDEVFVEMSKLETAFSSKDETLLKQNLDYTEAAFAKILQELEASKANNDSQEHIEGLIEKIDLLKSEINLASTDALANISAQSDKISQSVVALQSDIKTVMEAVLFTANENLKQDIQYYLKSIASLIQPTNGQINTEVFTDLKNVEMNINKTLGNLASDNVKVSDDIIKLLGEVGILNDDIKGIKDRFEQSFSQATIELKEFLEDFKQVNQKEKEDIINYLEKQFEEVKNTEALAKIETAVVDAISAKMSVLSDEAQASVKALLDSLGTEMKNAVKLSNNEKLELSIKANEELNALITTSIEDLKSAIVQNLQVENEPAFDISVLTRELDSMLNSLTEKFGKDTENLFEKMSDVNNTVEEHVSNIKAELLDEFKSRFEDFKEFYSAQNSMLKMSAEIKNSINQLEDKFVESNVNSTMEISKLLFSLLNEISRLKSTDITNEGEIQVKAVEAPSMDSAQIEKSIFDAKEEIKKILSVQAPLMSRLENTTQKEDFEILQNNLKEVLITFNTKLDAIITSNKDTGMKDSLREVIESIEKTLNNFGQEMISSVVGVFNGISFDVEKQELKDFVSTKADDIKDAAAQNFANISAQFNERAGEIKEKTELAKAEILSEIKEVLSQKIRDNILESTGELVQGVGELKDYVETSNAELSQKLGESLSALLASDKYEQQAQKIEEKLHQLGELFVEKLSPMELLSETLKDSTKALDIKIDELQSGIIDVVKATFIEAFDEKYSNFILRFDSLDDVISKVKSTLQSFENSLDSLKPELVDSVKAKFDELASLTQSQVVTVSNQIADVQAELKSTLSDKASELTTGVENAKNIICEIDNRIYDYVVSQIPTLLSAEKSQEYVALFEKKIDDLAEDFITKLGSVELLNDLVNDQTSAFANELESLKVDVAQIVKDNFKEEFEQKYEVLKSQLENNLAKIKTDSEVALGNIGADISNKFETDVVAKIGQFEANIAQLFDNVTSTIKVGLDKNVSELDASNSDVKEALTQLQKNVHDDLDEKVSDIEISNLKVRDALTELQGNISANYDNTLEQVNSSSQLVEKTLKDIEVNILDNLGSKVTEESTSARETVVNALSDIHSNIVSRLENDVVTNIANTQQRAEELITNLDTGLTQLIQANVTHLEESLTNVSLAQNDLSSNVNEVKTQIDAKVADIVSNINLALSTSLEKISALGEKSSTLQEDIFTKISEQLSTLQTEQSSTDKFEALKDSIKALSQEFINSISSVDALENVVKDSVKDVNSGMTALRADIVDIIKTAFSEIFEEKVNNIIEKLTETINSDFNGITAVLKENNSQILDGIADKNIEITNKLIDVKSDIVNSIDEIKKITLNSDISLSDIKEILMNRLEDINDIKTELSLIPKEKEVQLYQIDDLLIKNFNELREDLNLNPEKKLELADIENLAQSLTEELKEQISNTDVSINEIYDLLDGRTEAINNQIKNLIVQTLKPEDITDLLNDKLDDIRADLRVASLDKDELINTTNDISATCDIIDTEIKDVKSILKNLDSTTENVDTKCVDIKDEINKLKSHLDEIEKSVKGNESDYPYTFEDIETDISKVRLILKELTVSNALTRDEGLEKIEEDLLSISTRTNKILLNWDETANFLQSNMEDLKNLVTLFDNKVTDFDYVRLADLVETKINDMAHTVYHNAQENKRLTEAFTYLAEWIDKTDEKLYDLEQKIEDISYVKDNMIKKSDLEDIFERVVNKMDKQEEKIKSLEETVRILSQKEINVKTLVQEVMSTVPESQLAQKVDGIDRQLATLGKNIEKITSYVD